MCDRGREKSEPKLEEEEKKRRRRRRRAAQ